MTKQLLESKIKDYEAERTKLLQNASAFSGAIEDCKYWIEELENSNAKHQRKTKKIHEHGTSPQASGDADPNGNV
jgi:hypothetical protein